MAKLKHFWIEKDNSLETVGYFVIRIDWDNDRHQQVEIRGSTPKAVFTAFQEAAALIQEEISRGNI